MGVLRNDSKHRPGPHSHARDHFKDAPYHFIPRAIHYPLSQRGNRHEEEYVAKTTGLGKDGARNERNLPTEGGLLPPNRIANLGCLLAAEAAMHS